MDATRLIKGSGVSVMQIPANMNENRIAMKSPTNASPFGFAYSTLPTVPRSQSPFADLRQSSYGKRLLWIVVFHMLLMTPVVLHAQKANAPVAGGEPNKQALIGTLTAVFPLLKKKDFASASRYFVLPDDFRPEMLDGMIKRREISMAGVMRLQADAKFGTAVEVFGKDRGEFFASTMGFQPAECYGFKFETKEATAEVLAHWDGTQFRIMRLDDVGKLLPPSTKTADSDKPRGELAALTKEQIVAKLPELEKAVADSPEDVVALAQLATAMFRLENTPAAWRHLLTAYKVQPTHVGINRGLNTVFGAFENKGAFTVGVPPETVTGLLGEPEKTVDLGKRQRYVYGYYGADFEDGKLHQVVDLRGLTDEMLKPTEIIDMELDSRGRRCGFRKVTGRMATARWYLPGELGSNWTELVTIELIRRASVLGDIEKIEEMMIEQVKQRNPGASAKRLDLAEKSVIVAFQFPASKNLPERHQLVRVMMGPTDVHRVDITIKGEAPSQETQMKWLNILKAAKLKTVAKPSPESGK